MTLISKDGFERPISYVRLSVTDRCDLRCFYCMRPDQSFLPRSELLSFEDLHRLIAFLVASGVNKLRITGGEPLVRKGILDFLVSLRPYVDEGRLKELTLTTNGTLLAEAAPYLVASGIKRINVSCDSLNPETFSRITRGGDLSKVLQAIQVAQDQGLKIKLNIVALKHDNRAELPSMIDWAHGRQIDVSLIEIMPLDEALGTREDQFVSLAEIMSDLSSFWRLTPLAETTSGPARYYQIAETGGKLGLITPLSHNFCDTCNRVRITCTGRLYMCLGQEDHVDLREALRGGDEAQLQQIWLQALRHKPKSHDFLIAGMGLSDAKAYIPKRTMSVTGG